MACPPPPPSPSPPPSPPPNQDDDEPPPEGGRIDLDTIFSGEEGHGRYFDLHELHNRFVNAKFGRQVDYLTYLQQVVYFSEVPATQRTSAAYQHYLEDLVGYLEGFYERTQPLGDLAKQMSKVCGGLHVLVGCWYWGLYGEICCFVVRGAVGVV